MMRYLFDIGHPAHVHYFRNAIQELEKKGHTIIITARDKEVTKQLLEAYGLKYTITDKHRSGLFGKIFSLIKNDLVLYKIAKKFKPDLLVSFGSPYAAFASRLLGKKHVMFTDTEHAKLVIWLTFPFTDLICTSLSYTRKIDPKKHKIFQGYMELTYLHPNYFKADPKVLDDLHVSRDDTLFILRFVSWDASHDLGQTGFSFEDKKRLVKELSNYGVVLISSETKLPKELEQYELKIAPEKIHSVLSYCDLLIGESATMASESAVLGVPSIFVDQKGRGYTDELEEKYGLVYNFREHDIAAILGKAKQILKKPKEGWQQSRERLLSDSEDVTKFMVNLLENNCT
ncbi:DUF354 domain-containing protein [Candidatus Altiarchaeota archaeon]